jgi:hypothetical protein
LLFDGQAPIEVDTKQGVALIGYRKAQAALLPRIEEILAKTQDGVIARAKAACAWALAPACRDAPYYVTSDVA